MSISVEMELFVTEHINMKINKIFWWLTMSMFPIIIELLNESLVRSINVCKYDPKVYINNQQKTHTKNLNINNKT